MKIKLSRLGFSAFALAFAAQALATAVIPTSYTFDQNTACGSWCYHDPSFSKLTDGVVGKAGWGQNSGTEWAGWAYTNAVNIDFNFGSQLNIDSVSIGSTQDNLSDVALPSFDVWAKESNNWVLKGSLNNAPSSANDHDPYSSAPHPFYTLSGLNIHSNQVRVTAKANGPWIFVDEVQFQAAAVPEPETFALMLAGLGLVGVTRLRRKSAK